MWFDCPGESIPGREGLLLATLTIIAKFLFLSGEGFVFGKLQSGLKKEPETCQKIIMLRYQHCSQ